MDMEILEIKFKPRNCCCPQGFFFFNGNEVIPSDYCKNSLDGECWKLAKDITSFVIDFEDIIELAD